MKELNIYRPYIKGYAEKDRVCFFEGFGGYWVDQENELYAKMKEIEKEHKCKVYAITHEHTEFGELYDFLIVTDYPDHIVAFRRGDFYEILGSNAELFAKEFSLTLTGRDCGLSERVPMVGFPFQTADTYLPKAVEKGYKIAVVDTLDDVKLLEKEEPKTDTSEKHWIDEQTYVDDDGVMHYAEYEALPYDPTAFDVEALCKIDELFGNEIEMR